MIPRRSPAPSPRRRRAERTGRYAELLCRAYLRLLGWRILARDWRCPSGEIDIVARRGSVVAVVEVKSRRDAATAAEAVTTRQRRRISRAAAAYLQTRPDLAGCAVRFDVMLVERLRPPRHLRAAWRVDD